MSNSLDRDILPGEVVILNKKYFVQLSDYRFRCTGGFGLKSFTAGSAIYGEFLVDGEKSRIEGYMIDKEATEAYHLELSKDLE